MFGTDRMDPAQVTDIAREIAQGGSPFEVAFDAPYTQGREDDGLSRAFLAVNEGKETLVQLYGMLADAIGMPRRSFKPHLTLATTNDTGRVAAALDAANALPLPIEARIDALTVAQLTGVTVTEVACLALPTGP